MGLFDFISPFIAPVAGLVGDVLGIGASKKSSKRAQNIQDRALTHGIRYRVADARAAGINPLAALGANITTPSPVGVGDPGYSRMGQNLSYNVNQMLMRQAKKSAAIDIAQKKKNLDLTQAQIDAIYFGLPPRGSFIEKDLGSMGQGDALGTVTQGSQKTPLQSAHGYYPDEQLYLWYGPSQAFSEPMESDIYTKFKWAGVRGTKEAQRYIQLQVGNVNERMKIAKTLRSIRPIIKDPQYKGYQANWSVQRGQWKLVPSDGNKSIFADGYTISGNEFYKEWRQHRLGY